MPEYEVTVGLTEVNIWNGGQLAFTAKASHLSDLATQMYEAELAVAGYELVEVKAAEVEPGDRIHGDTVEINEHGGFGGMVTVLHFNSYSMSIRAYAPLTVERRIE